MKLWNTRLLKKLLHRDFGSLGNPRHFEIVKWETYNSHSNIVYSICDSREMSCSSIIGWGVCDRWVGLLDGGLAIAAADPEEPKIVQREKYADDCVFPLCKAGSVDQHLSVLLLLVPLRDSFSISN